MLNPNNAIDKTVYGNMYDIKLNAREMQDLSEAIIDDKYSNKAIVRFKHLRRTYYKNTISTFLLSGIPSYMLVSWAMGSVRRRSADLKIFFPTFVTTYSILTCLLLRVQTSRRMLTEAFTDESDDGTHLREAVREKCPNIWKDISFQLEKIGYQFPEMIQYDDQTIPKVIG